MSFFDLFSADDVILDARASSKDGLLDFLGAEAASRLGYAKQEVVDALKAREQIGSTGIGRGVALPHAELRGSARGIILFARVERPLPFEAEDDQPVDLIFLVLWPAGNRNALLKVIAEICGYLRDSRVLRRLRSAAISEDVLETLRAAADSGGGFDER